MIGALSEVCAGLPDQRKGPRRDGDYTMADIALAAFSIFFMGSPSFHDAGGNFILTCKPSSHKTIAEYLHGAERQEHRQTVCKRGKRTTTIYRWLSGVPLRA